MSDELIAEVADEALRAACTPQRVAEAERDGWSPALWKVAADIGLPWISVPEQHGGVGGSLAEAITVLRVVGSNGVPLPVAECGVLAGWLLSSCGLTIGPGVTTTIPGRPGDALAVDRESRLYGRVQRVPWARAAEHVVGLATGADGQTVVVRFAAADAVIETDENLAGEPRDTLTVTRVRALDLAPAPDTVTAAELRARGALSRAALISGALNRASELTLTYARDRRQFGRALRSFQAVQAHLVRGAQDAALVALATQAATAAAQRGACWFEIPAVKLLANDAATTAAAVAHQVHAAMGMTTEYPLQLLTRRLWSWREEYGNSAYWSGVLGRALEPAGADQLYPTIAGGSSAMRVPPYAHAIAPGGN